MKVRRSRVQKIIQEELDRALQEMVPGDPHPGTVQAHSRLDRIRNDGYNAGLESSTTDLDNPFPRGSREYNAWNAGFEEALYVMGDLSEVAPPGREDQVKALKKEPGIDNPYAVAWAQHKKHGKPKQEAQKCEGEGYSSEIDEGESAIVEMPVPEAPWAHRQEDLPNQHFINAYNQLLDHNGFVTVGDLAGYLGVPYRYVRMKLKGSDLSLPGPVEELDEGESMSLTYTSGMHVEPDLMDEDDDGPFEGWTDDQARRSWQSMGGSFDSVVKKSAEFADDPHAYAAALQKRATGRWPTEEGAISLSPILSEAALDVFLKE